MCFSFVSVVLHAVPSGPVAVLRVHHAVVFFFQAEDGIRDADVTGVQTCALPISTLTIGPADSAGAVVYLVDVQRGAICGPNSQRCARDSVVAVSSSPPKDRRRNAIDRKSVV